MEPTNKKDKFAVPVIGGPFEKTIFYFLWESKYHGCRVHVTGQTINQGMKSLCTLIFKGQSEKTEKTYVNKPEIVLKGTIFLFIHRSNQPSDALKSLHPNPFAK